ncbi:MAG: protein kinase domain-containing protein [Thermomicrobiales bacterium]
MMQPQSLINGRYRVGRRLGDGGMAIVYLGHDLLLGRDVAIKTLRPQFAAHSGFRTRFEREARAAAALSHPNIIDVYDVGEDDGTPFIVMELVRGQTLKEIIAADAPFHPSDVAELLEQIGAALDYAHARGYVHRDIKPGNILVDEHGRARVVDFGIAKGLADADLTELGAGLGTVGYLSPEQAEGLMATPASDIYSAAVVAYEMLTGELPFTAETPVGLAMRHLHDPAPAPSSRVSGIPIPIDAVILRALAKDPTQRWPSVSAFAQALRGVQVGKPIPIRHDPEPDIPPQSSASLAPTIVIVILIVAALAALLWTGFRSLPRTEEDTQPTVLVPPGPVITGEIDAEEPSTDEVAPVIVPQEEQAPIVAIPTIPAESAIPTIAPVTNTTIAVPNLQGLTIAGATQALDPLGLRIALAQPVFSESVPLNAVAAQEPPVGSPVSSGAVIRVSLSRGPSPFPSDGQP